MSLILLKIGTSLILMLANTYCRTNSQKVHHFIPEPQIPTECFDKGYCEHVPNYPKKYAASLIAKLRKQGVMNLNFHRLISIQESDDTFNLCHHEKTIVAPQAAKDSGGKWHFILNQESNPIQQYLAIKCKQLQSSNSAATRCENNYMFIEGATAVCLQKNTTIRLVTFNGYGKTTSQSFEVPCCCSCEAAPNSV